MLASCTRSTSIAVTDSQTPGQRDRQRVHRESGVDAGAEHGHARALAPARRSSSPPRALLFTGYASSSVVETIGTFSLSTASNSGTTFFSDELVQSTATSGRTALIVRAMSSVTFTPQRRPHAADVAEVAADLGRIDVHGADDRQSLAAGDLTDHARADGPESDMQHLDGHDLTPSHF